jgi:hypothetical protein
MGCIAKGRALQRNSGKSLGDTTACDRGGVPLSQKLAQVPLTRASRMPPSDGNTSHKSFPTADRQSMRQSSQQSRDCVGPTASAASSHQRLGVARPSDPWPQFQKSNAREVSSTALQNKQKMIHH